MNINFSNSSLLITNNENAVKSRKTNLSISIANSDSSSVNDVQTSNNYHDLASTTHLISSEITSSCNKKVTWFTKIIKGIGTFPETFKKMMIVFSQFFSLLQRSKQVELEEIVAALDEKYDQQVILNLGSGRSGGGLNAKATKNKLPSQMIDLRNHGDCSILSKLTPYSRLYIVGHCLPGGDYICSDENKQVRIDEFVEMLFFYAPQLTKSTSKQKVKISIVACHAGVPKKDEKSFGYRLSQSLYEKGIQAEVIARTGRVSRWDGSEGEIYKKKVDGRHQEKGSKLIFTTENGVTSVKPFSYTP